MVVSSFVIKGDLCYSVSPTEIATMENGYVVCENFRCAGVFTTLPKRYRSLPLLDYTGNLVLPGLVDLHVHAPQYSFRGTGMDLELLDWLNTHTFPEESKYRDLMYARYMYSHFVQEVAHGPNTRACIFATVHRESTTLLMDLLEESGLYTMVGKVNMDRNSPDTLRERNAVSSAEETIAWLESIRGRYQRTFPILTPRFIPSCTDALMEKLAQIQRRYHLPVQSHLSENLREISWVRELCPQAQHYGDAYYQFGLFGGQDCPTIMAHCVYSSEDELALIKKQQVFVAHCPASNMNLASGIAPVRRFLEEGICVGLGSDVAGGTCTSIFRAMTDAIQVSKLRWRLQDSALLPLKFPEAFYLGTVGGGSFFGDVGTFYPNYSFDAIVVSDDRYNPVAHSSLMERLERCAYLSEDRDVIHKFVAGRQLF